jgi:hypothetical protein
MDEVMRLPSIDALAYDGPNGPRRTVADMMPSKKADFGVDKWRYGPMRESMQAEGQQTPIHVFKAGKQAYGQRIPEELRGQLMAGNGHHRVAMLHDQGATHVMYTPHKQKSATDEDG